MIRKGFTLVELMVVVAIIGFLTTIALFGLRKAQAAARDTQRVQFMTSYQTALERFYSDNLGYPNAAGVGSNVNHMWYLTALLQGWNYNTVWDPKGPSSGYMGCAWNGLCPPIDPYTKDIFYKPTGGGPSQLSTSPLIVTDYIGSNCGSYLCQGYQLILTQESGGVTTYTNPF